MIPVARRGPRLSGLIPGRSEASDAGRIPISARVVVLERLVADVMRGRRKKFVCEMILCKVSDAGKTKDTSHELFALTIYMAHRVKNVY